MRPHARARACVVCGARRASDEKSGYGIGARKRSMNCREGGPTVKHAGLQITREGCEPRRSYSSRPLRIHARDDGQAAGRIGDEEEA